MKRYNATHALILFSVVALLLTVSRCNLISSSPFVFSFEINRPTFLNSPENEIVVTNSLTSIFSYYGKFKGDQEQFRKLCQLLGLQKSKAPHIMKSAPNSASWWNLLQLEQIKEFDQTYYSGFEVNDKLDGIELGTLARLSNGYIFLTKVGSR